jgi:hypothetical protein
MVHRRWRPSALLVVALVGALVMSTVALASGLSNPVQKSPGNNARVHAGKITFKVKDPGVPKSVQPVYIAIGPTKAKAHAEALNKNPKGCSHTCDFVAMHPWKGHPGMWIYTSQFNFPGYWAVTPGKYYWQAQHVAPLCQAPHCLVFSQIHSFRVVG